MPSTTSDQYRETEAGERYARAAFDLAQDTGVLDVVHGDVANLKALLIASGELRTFVGSQVYKSDVKLKGLLAVATAKKGAGLTLSPLTEKILGVLAANGRLGDLFPFINAFNALYAAHKGIVSAEVTSAVALSDVQLEDLKKTLAKTLGHSADISTTVDPAILGGLKVRVGSRLFDASLKTKLDSLKFALKRA
ncbi:ATP synthase F1 subunit delta [Asticcacaulis sp. 201]|uniref:ATP synthase F1 subunit delta n=1 Tax=Asticcacaulis sp. 201 TaxID=3028787 RepID=UPI002916ED79|nr:ATP synthase F1 subunit delta [Asticcacaulis sp. 201]MDV6331605.1 ATP synthase F1 subunit delta [Asticcacaulis sp. 201]